MKKIGVLVLWILSYGTEPYARFFDFPLLFFATSAYGQTIVSGI